MLAFPGIFRGALDVRASDINDEMKIAAAYAIAGLISDEELNAEYIIPAPFDPRVGPAVAKAVAEAAREERRSEDINNAVKGASPKTEALFYSVLKARRLLYG